jgi:[ribosomal protein S5]-alanine N-acetyltransferase
VTESGLGREAFPSLVTDRLVLRLGTDADIPAILRFYAENGEFLKPWEPLRPPGFGSEAFWTARLATAREEYQRRRAIRFFLFERDPDNEVSGTVSFTRFVGEPFHACNLGYSLARRAEGTGRMREALETAIAHVFEVHGVHRIQANYMPHNRRSGNLLRRLGFSVEGYARDYLRIDGRWEDHVLTSLTNPDWEAS